MSIEPKLSAISNYTFGQSREPLMALQDAVIDAAKNPAHKSRAAAQLAAFLGTNATFDAKQYACRQLVVVGGPENAAAIAALLYDPKTTNIARYALEPIQGRQVDAELLKALKTVDTTSKIGIINTLGARKSSAGVSALGKLARSEDAALAEASVAALGSIGTPAAARKLAAAKKDATPERRTQIAEAELCCARCCAAKGDTANAQKIYSSLSAESNAQVQSAAKDALAKAHH